jgi:ubiquitin carboxyl-terminal hydrolase 9/13
MLCERNKFHCDNCGGLQEAEKRMKIKRLPRILALHLKRFKYTEDLQRLQKLFHRVVYPYYLRLFNTTDDAEDPDRLYELYAVVVHIGGGPYHGHYVSIIKTQDRGWLLFDDEMVEPVDKAYVRNFFGGENVLACAYVLFYQETTLEAMQKEMEEEGAAAAEQTVDVPMDSVSSPIKTNGTANGHPLQHASTPSLDDDQFTKLNHAATAPPIISDYHHHHQQHQQQPLEHVVTALPVLSPKKSNLASKKERAREEKERKAAEKLLEKEAEKQAKQKRKELETQRRETFRKQEEDLRAALAASKKSQAEEEKRRKGGVSPPGQNRQNDAFSSSVPLDTSTTASTTTKDKDSSKENGLSKTKSLSRFRQTSMTLRHKPKFWSGKEKSADEKDMLPDHNGEHGRAGTTSTAADSEAAAEKPSKNRFSLGRKKSAFLH